MGLGQLVCFDICVKQNIAIKGTYLSHMRQSAKELYAKRRISQKVGKLTDALNSCKIKQS